MNTLRKSLICLCALACFAALSSLPARQAWCRPATETGQPSVMNPADSRNLFLSLELPGKLADRLVALQKRLPPEKTELQARENFHVTLAYFPKVSPEKEAGLKQFLHESLPSRHEISLRFTGEIAHGSWTRAADPAYKHDPKVVQRDEQIRLTLVLNKRLEALRAAVVEYAKANGLLPPTFSQPFSPHVTVGVVRTDVPFAEFSKVKPPTGEYWADLTTLQAEAALARYELVEKYPLKSRRARPRVFPAELDSGHE